MIALAEWLAPLGIVCEGMVGPEGPEGPQGEQGIQGQQGIQGIQGTAGAQGDPGQQGIQGIQGPQGEPGAALGVLAAYPVGCIYTTTVATNPGSIFGGTWVAAGAGQVLVGFSNGDLDFGAPGASVGAKTVTLDVTQIPAHTHVQNAHTHVQDPHSHGIDEGQTDGAGTFMDRSNVASATTTTTNAATAVNQNATAVNQNTGGGLPHSNIQPSLVVYFFRRTA